MVWPSNGTAVSALRAAHRATTAMSHEPKRMSFEPTKIKNQKPNPALYIPSSIYKHTHNIYLIYIYIHISIRFFLSNGIAVSAPRAAHKATEPMSHEPTGCFPIIKNNYLSSICIIFCNFLYRPKHICTNIYTYILPCTNGIAVVAPCAAHWATEPMSHEPKWISSVI